MRIRRGSTRERDHLTWERGADALVYASNTPDYM